MILHQRSLTGLLNSDVAMPLRIEESLLSLIFVEGEEGMANSGESVL